MAIWFDDHLTVEKISKMGKGNMGEFLGIELLEVGEDFLRARMPVNDRTRQPFGLLHGGASCVLAETIGSVASACVVDYREYDCVGLEINANHIRGIREGYVTGTGRPIHLGASTHVWEIRIADEQDRLVCISRLTVMVMKKRTQVMGKYAGSHP